MTKFIVAPVVAMKIALILMICQMPESVFKAGLFFLKAGNTQIMIQRPLHDFLSEEIRFKGFKQPFAIG